MPSTGDAKNALSTFLPFPVVPNLPESPEITQYLRDLTIVLQENMRVVNSKELGVGGTTSIGDLTSDVPIVYNVSWGDDDPDASSVSWSGDDSALAMSLSYRDRFFEITAGNSNKKYIYWDLASPLIFAGTDTLGTAIGPDKWVMSYNDVGTAYPAIGAKIIHGGIIQASTITTTHLLARTILAGDIAVGVITTTELNFVPATSTNVIASINASAEGINIEADNIAISGTTTFTSGWAVASNAETDINVLNTTNAPAVSGATDDTAADIANAKLTTWSHGSDVTKIDGGDIFTGSVTAAKITVTNLAALNADMGTITAGSMSTDRLTSGTLLVGRTEAKATDADADQTSANTAANAATYTGASISTTYTAAKATDPNADQTSANTSNDTSNVNGLAATSVSGWSHVSDTTKIDGGDIFTNTILAASISTYNLTAINATLENLIVKTAAIDNLSIGTGKVVADAITNIIYDNDATSLLMTGSQQTCMTSSTLNISASGSKVIIEGVAVFENTSAGIRDATVVVDANGGNITTFAVYNHGHPSWPHFTIPFYCVTTGVTGNYTWRIRALSSGANVYYRTGWIKAQEFKK